jgi:hypothetical protein
MRTSYLPTPEEVQKSCRAIQETWTRGKRNKRSVGAVRRWMPPVIAVADLAIPNRGSLTNY